MKFFAIVIAALAGIAFAAPVQNSIISQVTGVLGDVTGNTPVGQLENQLQGVFGDALPQIEESLGGIPLADKLLDLIHGGLKPAAIQAVGQGLALVQSGLPINAVNTYLNQVTNGTVGNLEETLGTQDLVGALTGVTGLVSGLFGSV